MAVNALHLMTCTFPTLQGLQLAAPLPWNPSPRHTTLHVLAHTNSLYLFLTSGLSVWTHPQTPHLLLANGSNIWFQEAFLMIQEDHDLSLSVVMAHLNKSIITYITCLINFMSSKASIAKVAWLYYKQGLNTSVIRVSHFTSGVRTMASKQGFNSCSPFTHISKNSSLSLYLTPFHCLSHNAPSKKTNFFCLGTVTTTQW